jgi:glycosyltransferase involved in cell wall biosynthesis
MKILLINKHYYRKGGAETVFFNTKELLEKNGHEVVVFSMKHIDNEESKDEKYFVSFVDITTLRGWYYKMFRFLYNVKASSNLKKLIKAEKPDLAHLHNVYHQLTYSIIKPLKKYKIPIVETLHDYHLISPNYHLYHDGEICERSRDGNYLKSIFHRCIGHSFIKSFAGA